MIGPRYWSTGISLKWADGRWAGELKYHDDGFANDSVDAEQIATEGTLSTRYWVRPGIAKDALTVIIDTLIRDAERLGIEWRFKMLYFEGDGESKEYPPPAHWRATLRAQAERIGWETYSEEELGAR